MIVDVFNIRYTIPLYTNILTGRLPKNRISKSMNDENFMKTSDKFPFWEL